jgi:hypothetical protein
MIRRLVAGTDPWGGLWSLWAARSTVQGGVVRGRQRVGWTFTFGMVAFNLIRMRRLLPEAA